MRIIEITIDKYCYLWYLIIRTGWVGMFVSFEASNLGTFKDKVGISLIADATKSNRELLVNTANDHSAYKGTD